MYRRALTVFAFLSMLFVTVDLAKAQPIRPKPAALVVFDSQGSKNGPGGVPTKPLEDFHIDLANAVYAHANVFQDVTVLYQSASQPFIERCKKEESKRLVGKRGKITYTSFDTTDIGGELIQSWIDEFFSTSNGNTPGPFCYFIVMGHGVTRDGNQCLISGDDVIDLGRIVKGMDRQYRPVICVQHLCRDDGFGPSRPAVAGVQPDPLLVQDTDLESFAKNGRNLGIRIGNSYARSVVTIASTEKNKSAANDHKFFEAYFQAFQTVQEKRMEIFNVRRSSSEKRGLESSSRSVLLWGNILQYMGEAHQRYLVGLKPGEQPRHWDLSTGSMGSHSISGAHVVASTDPNAKFSAPAIELSERFEPAVDVGPNEALSFKFRPFGEFKIIEGNRVVNASPYGSVNVKGLFADQAGGKVRTQGKTLYIQLFAKHSQYIEQNQYILFNNNDGSSSGGSLREVVQIPRDFEEVRIPAEGPLPSGVEITGLSLVPCDEAGQVQNNGWMGKELSLGKMLLVDAGPEESFAVAEWKEWHSALTNISLTQRWIPQFWWHDHTDSTVKLTNAGVAPCVEVTGAGRKALGGPLLFVPSLDSKSQKLRLKIEIGKAPKLQLPEGLDLLLFNGDKIVLTHSIKLGKTKPRQTRTEYFSTDPPDYLAIVIHGTGSFVVNDIRFTK